MSSSESSESYEGYSESSTYLNTDTEYGTTQTGGGKLETEALQGELLEVLRMLEKSEAFSPESESTGSVASSFFQTSVAESSLSSLYYPKAKSSSKRKMRYKVVRQTGGERSTTSADSTDSVSDDTVRIVKVKKPKPLSPLPEETSISSTDTDSSRSSSESSA